MKKIKQLKKTFFVTSLSLVLAVNAFGFDTGGAGIIGLIGSFFNGIVATFSGDDDNCPFRICQGCRPTDGTCKPVGN